MTARQIKLLSLAISVVIALGAGVIYTRWAERRDRLVESANFAPGTPLSEVVAVMGAPSHEVSGPAVRRYAPDFSCGERSVRLYAYSRVGLTSSPACAIYFDSQDRVVCVNHLIKAWE